MKDTYRADVDVRNLACCRPESVYHPDKLQTCIVCRSSTGHPHDPTCPLVLYRRPEKGLAEHPHLGPRPAVKECSQYNVRIRTTKTMSIFAGLQALVRSAYPSDSWVVVEFAITACVFVVLHFAVYMKF